MAGENGQLALTQRGRDVCAFLLEKFPALSALDEVAKGKVSYEMAVGDVRNSLKER